MLWITIIQPIIVMDNYVGTDGASIGRLKLEYVMDNFVGTDGASIGRLK